MEGGRCFATARVCLHRGDTEKSLVPLPLTTSEPQAEGSRKQGVSRGGGALAIAEVSRGLRLPALVAEG